MSPQPSLLFGSSLRRSVEGLLIFQHTHLPHIKNWIFVFDESDFIANKVSLQFVLIFPIPISVLANANHIGFALCKNSLISLGVTLTNVA